MLSQKKCVPCNKGCEPLSPEKAAELLKQLPGWEFTKEGKAIRRRFSFKNFMQALDFVNSLAPIAEAENHHPDLQLGWGYVECMLWTHDIGGLHENDFIIASKINRLTDKM